MIMGSDGIWDGGPAFYFDFLRVLVTEGGVYESMVVDDADDQWNYSPNWINGSHVGEYLETDRTCFISNVKY